MFPEGEIQSASIPTGKYWSNYMAEIQALVQASSMVRDSENEYQQVVFLSDALSVLEPQQETNSFVLQKAFMRSHRIGLQCVPAHCGLQGN